MAALLECEQVCKRFGAERVLDQVSFRIDAGEAVALVGVNGAGKTTLLRGLLDLNRIDAGTVTIAGLPHTVTASRRGLSYLAERFSPPPFASGEEFLRHLLALHGRRLDLAAMAREAVALDLEPKVLQRRAREYSKGMAQKLGLLGCILADSPLLVLDEPMSGLDPKARALFKQRLAALRDAGAGLLFSSHLLVDVEALCNRMMVLDGGRLVFNGAPSELLAATAAPTLEAAFLACIGATS